MLKPLIAAFVFVSAAAAQAPVPVEQEPRHKTLFLDAAMRVLEVTIPKGDTTLDHTHRLDLATVCLECTDTRSRAPGKEWGPIRSRAVGSAAVTEYAGKPDTHAVRTIGDGRYRLIAVENQRAGGWAAGAALQAPATMVLQEARAFRIYEVRLGPDEPQVVHVHAAPVVTVRTAGRLVPDREWEVVPARRSHTLNAESNGTATVVEIELR